MVWLKGVGHGGARAPTPTGLLQIEQPAAIIFIRPRGARGSRLTHCAIELDWGLIQTFRIELFVCQRALLYSLLLFACA